MHETTRYLVYKGEVQREGIFLKSVSSNSYGVDEHIVRGTMEAAVARTLS